MEDYKPVLLIEDDEIDVRLVERAFKQSKKFGSLIILNNGDQAIEYLKNEENEKPGIILLDLNMPMMNGKEFLQKIKKESNFNLIPVIIFSTSEDEEEIKSVFDLGAVGYMIKPINNEEFVKKITATLNYWTMSEIP